MRWLKPAVTILAGWSLSFIGGWFLGKEIVKRK